MPTLFPYVGGRGVGGPSPVHPAGTAASPSYGPLRAACAGATILVETPALILAATGAGFGALAKDAGIAGGHAAFLSIAFYATPAQVVLIDQMARGASLFAIALAITLTGIRLLPMTASMMPHLRGSDPSGSSRQGASPPAASVWPLYIAAHFVAVTGWSEALRRLPHQPVARRVPYFLGFGFALMMALVTGTLVGYELAGRVPAIVTSALLFMTPVYFLLSQILNVQKSVDARAILLGAILGPVFLILAPGLDLLLAGLVGGTLAVGLGRRTPS